MTAQQDDDLGTSPQRVEEKVHPLRRSDIRVHQLDEEGLIHDSISGNTHWLNSTALFIWQKCDGGHTAQDIARMMTQVYEVSPESALAHVERLIDELKARNLVQPFHRETPFGGPP